MGQHRQPDTNGITGIDALNLKAIAGARRLTSQQLVEVRLGGHDAGRFLVPAGEFLEMLEKHREWMGALPLYGDGFVVPPQKEGAARLELHQADLRYANLSGVVLGGADLKGCYFTNANLQKGGFYDANLEGANLVEVHAQQIALHCAVLRRADMAGARMDGACLMNADLEGAQMQGCSLTGSQMMWANLKNAGLYGAFLKGCDLRGADLSGADLQMVNLQKADLEGADLRDADLRGADLYGANLRGAHLGGANLQGVDLLGANMEGARLRGTIMTGEDLDGAKLQGANLRGAKLKKAKSREWEKKSDEDAGLRYLLRKQLREEDEGLDYFWILYFLVATPLAALSLTAWTEHWQWGIESYAPFVKIGLDYFESQIQGQTITPVLGGIENLTGLGWPGWLADFLGFYLLIGGAMWLWRRRMMDIPSEPNMWTFLGGHLGNTGMNLISVISWPITMVAGLAGLGKRWERRAVRSLMVLVLAFFLFAILAAMSLVQ